MNKFLLLFLVVFTANLKFLNAESRLENSLVKSDPKDQEKFCIDRNPNLVKEYQLPGEPSYWIKPFEMNKKLFFTAVVDLKPVVISAESGQVSTLKGDQDPLASFDNQILTVLEGREGKFKLKFYSPIESADKIDTKKYDLSLDIYGAYQSIAPVKNKNGGTSYRLLLDRLEVGGSGTTSPSVLEFEKKPNSQLKVTRKFRTLCPDKKLQTPFISKDGKMFAALNVDTQTTQVFDISSDQCILKNDLGFMTGKADFNSQGTQIVFHLTGTDASVDGQGWIRNLSEGNWSNVYVYDMASKRIKPVTQNKSSNSYYPVFLENGNIMHINSKQNSSDKSVYSVGVSKNPMAESSVTEGSVCANCGVSQVAGKLAVGQLLYGICSEKPFPRDRIDVNALIIKVSELSKADCKVLVDRYWSSKVQEMLDIKLNINYKGRVKERDMVKLKKEDLLVACE